MKKLRSLWKNEGGAVAVVVAFSLTALFGFVALALDFGLLAAEKQTLQNAADAAALAAAADLGRDKYDSVIRDTAGTYCVLNGCDPADDDVEMAVAIDRTAKTVRVTVSRQVPMGFSAVVTGQQKRRVSAAATAEAGSIFASYPYAMFAGQQISDIGITIGGNDIHINGNIHSNSKLDMPHAIFKEGVQHTDGSDMTLDMPTFSTFQRALGRKTGVVTYIGNQTQKNHDNFQALIDDAKERSGRSDLSDGLYIHIYGSLTFNGHDSTVYSPEFPIILVVHGSIVLNGAPIGMADGAEPDTQFPVAIMSETGNITVNGGGARYLGILYAPKGDIELNGNDAVFVGSIVAQNIRKTGGKITVSYYEDVDEYLPDSKVRLIN